MKFFAGLAGLAVSAGWAGRPVCVAGGGGPAGLSVRVASLFGRLVYLWRRLWCLLVCVRFAVWLLACGGGAALAACAARVCVCCSCLRWWLAGVLCVCFLVRLLCMCLRFGFSRLCFRCLKAMIWFVFWCARCGISAAAWLLLKLSKFFAFLLL